MTIIDSSELNRIRESSNRSAMHAGSSDPIVVRIFQCLHLSPQSSEVDRRERARAKREQIISIDRNRKCVPEMTELDIEDRTRDEKTVSKALHALDEEMDEVKKINQMIALAKVQTILEVQRDEKKRILEEEKLAERKVEALMEKERVQALTDQEKIEKKRESEHRHRSLDVLQQIKEREKLRVLDEEVKIKERLWLQRKVEQERLAEERRLSSKLEAQKQLREEIIKANELATQQKSEAKARSKEEDLMYLEYQRLLAQKERERDEVEALEAANREQEITRLRASQEKANNKEAALDALRAKRALEAAERAAREKERRDKEIQAQINKSLSDARRVQQAEKQLMILEQARMEKKEFDTLNETQARLEAAAGLRQDHEKQKQLEYVKELRGQISAVREKRAQERQDFLEEGNLIRAKMHAEQRRLNEVRKSKLELLIRSGVPEKHCMNIRKALKA